MIEFHIINQVLDEYVPDQADFQKWSHAIEYNGNAEITIKIVSLDEIKKYNMLYKNKDQVTDTLSFPFHDLRIDNKNIIGDIAMCANKINTDALLYKKKKLHRWAHLTIHSVLHILGYTHENKKKQTEMELAEINILKKFNILDPYEI
tara:strand:- start:287 stop:730 length:444 start_codon:yes stop_codon:yes gene_type:complete